MLIAPGGGSHDLSMKLSASDPYPTGHKTCSRARHRASSIGEIIVIFRSHWSCSLFVQRPSVSIATIAECDVR